MLPDAPVQIEKRADRVEEDRFQLSLVRRDHAGLMENCFLPGANTRSPPRSLFLLSKSRVRSYPSGSMIVSDETRALPRWSQSAREEVANSVSHGIGFIAAVIGTPVLLLVALRNGSAGFFVGTLVFTVTMSILYLGSTLYHAWPQTRAKEFFRLFDHSAIYLLIAGTYTPFALGPAMSLYLGMGWLIPLTNHPLMLAIPSSALNWLLAGGVAYTAGVFFFVNQRLRYSHFIWHLFVLAGTACHFVAVLSCAS